jgi:predicted PurR-regulated permease PerM
MARALTWAVFVGAACGLLYLCLLIVRPFGNVIAWSVVLAIVCSPLHQRLLRKTGRVSLSALAASLLVVFAFVVPLAVIAGVAINQGVGLADSLRAALHSPDRWVARVSRALASVTAGVGVDQFTIGGWLRGQRAEWMQHAGRYSVSFASGLLEALASSLFVVIALFLLLRDGEHIVAAIPDLLPFERPRSEALLRRIRDVVHASVYGVVVLALLHGVVYGTAFWLVGVPGAALWGMVTVFASVVPLVGAFAIWGPVAVYLAINGHWPHVLVLALTALVVSGVDHVLRPRLVAGRVGLSELSMFFALLGGVTAFGALGVVLGPVAFATVAAIVDALRDPAPGA